MRAGGDLRTGFAAWRLWGHLGWHDLKSRYRRSLLGPLWMTTTMGLTTASLGLLFSLLWHDPVSTFVPYVGTGLIVWSFISGCLIEGMDSFVASDELIKQTSAPLTVYVLRTVWRNTLSLAHNLIVYVILLVLFFGALHRPGYTMTGQPCPADGTVVCHPGLGWNTLMAIPGFLVLAAAGIAASLALGIVATRFRDAPQVVAALVQLLFVTIPITWPLDVLAQNAPGKVWLVKLNPLFHFVQIVRQPLIGQRLDWWSWPVVGVLTAAIWATALLLLRRYRARVSYWI
ncbi:ABC transporter permease [Amycolatopsis cynarae]|uniref:ABC transporter permease n=1 Tax=Amycolatopsis cynarae TaxID=2995223 RepID=A0ABY7B387_9PSEU|nr:ABC transporter permease [Amycolatopsis sp. HUAS 11-8]WAL66752.1 ABC transporter permease [Amycolatopsis sp. HUAS 11-8]